MNGDRRGDWEAEVDDRLVNLTSAQRSTDKELDDLDLKYEAIDKVIRGDPEQDTDGIIARIHNLENAIQELRAERVKFKVADVASTGLKWQAWAVIIAAILGLLGGILPNLTKIKETFRPSKEAKYQPDERLRKEIEADKRRHRRHTTHLLSAPPLVSSGSTPTTELK